jgi:hypothetical protein
MNLNGSRNCRYNQQAAAFFTTFSKNFHFAKSLLCENDFDNLPLRFK